MTKIISKVKGFIQSFLDDEKLTTIHPQTGYQIYYVFSCGGKNYFRYNHDVEMPIERFRFTSRYLAEMEEMKLSGDILVKLCNKIIEHSDKGEGSACARIAYEIIERS